MDQYQNFSVLLDINDRSIRSRQAKICCALPPLLFLTGHLWAPIVESGNKLHQVGEIEEEKDESSQADCSKPVIVIFFESTATPSDINVPINVLLVVAMQKPRQWQAADLSKLSDSSGVEIVKDVGQYVLSSRRPTRAFNIQKIQISTILILPLRKVSIQLRTKCWMENNE